MLAPVQRSGAMTTLGNAGVSESRSEWAGTGGRLAAVVLVGLLIWALPRPAAVEPRAWRLLAVFVATIVGFVVKPMPMSGLAILGMAVILTTRTLTLAETLSGFSNTTSWLVVAAFFFAAGVMKTGLGARIAYALIAVAGRTTLGLGYSLVATDLALAPAIASNTARAGGVVFPILQSICKTAIEADSEKGRKTSAFLTLLAYQATVVTSAMFATAMVANPLVVQLAASQHVTITWASWALAALVPGVLSLALVPLIVFHYCPPGESSSPTAPAMARASLSNLGAMTRHEWVMAVVAIALLIAWIFGPQLALEPAAAALIAVAALLVAGVFTWDDLLHEREAWNTFLWFSVLVMMAGFLGQLKVVDWFTTGVGSAVGGIGWVAGFLGLVLIYFYVHYFFASNTAHVAAMYAPFLAVSISIGTPPALAALVLAFFSNLNACTTHYGTPPGTILFASGYVPLHTWWKTGAVISVVHLIVWIGIGGLWWRVIGLW